MGPKPGALGGETGKAWTAIYFCLDVRFWHAGHAFGHADWRLSTLHATTATVGAAPFSA